jgi:hypothetical protein
MEINYLLELDQLARQERRGKIQSRILPEHSPQALVTHLVFPKGTGVMRKPELLLTPP